MLTTGDLEPLFMKDLPASGGDTETGLGTAFSGNPTHEIQGNNWIQVDISKIAHLSGVTLSIDSIQTGDSYNIFVSSTPGTVGTDEIFRRDTDHLVTITGAEIGTNSFIDVTAFSGNVLLEDATVSTTSVPEPGSAGLLLIGLGALVAAGTLGKKLIA
jgi:hypothetical protein